MTRHLLQAALVASSLASPMARADGGVDTVYHPYVQPLEQELELRLGHEHDTDRRDIETWRLGYGRSVSERVFVEGYVIGQGRRPDALSLAGYELEALWQLTEQGQYAADWALLGEFERAHNGDRQSGMVSLIGERQWGRLVGTLNAGVGYEWGADVGDEAETRLALQARYRYSPRLEPALAGIVNVIKQCPTPDGKGVHMVLNTDKGLVTVIYMPETPVTDGEQIAFDDSEAVLVQLPKGSAAIIGLREQQVTGLHALVQSSIVVAAAKS
jgi:hypothetical protein